ncbi:hypothetical protein A2755_00380 [Candidatus Wolfebacteria bacterium RIFCSPHIGHO2_01_FULL_48_22]|uniref:ATP-dependent Clp protease proteolytic subunit n=1 Tax=Candidatus Wolfebacteria bacterium RIFCSPHIGHO2_01_FULL_48_22 TaxID=1802555 RepID=A0A1F8DWV7_9BACT|nr:MAG: hypothetical protein A2755_00380 [Candidatus Wolfebacteria bacterium RIFCSPHIGHO2_01_FULL_48_22]
MLEIKGYITKATFDLFSSQLRHLTAQGTEEVTIYFNSPGGDVQPSLLLYETIKNSRVDTIIGVIDGECSSSAIVSFLACKKRYATKHSNIYLHAIEIKKKLPLITAEYLQERRAIQNELNGIILEKTTFPKNKLEGITNSGEDYKLFLSEAMSYGFIESIL